MDAKHAASHLRNRGTFYGDSVYDEIADLIETLARERDEARERALTDDDIDAIECTADRLATGLFVQRDDKHAAACLRAIVARLRPPKVEWTQVGDGAMAVVNGWTLVVAAAVRGKYSKRCWNWFATKVGCGADSDRCDDADTIDAAKAAAVEWARGH